ncbi:pentatricopeptide repeat-containing protein At1g77360, mitochondrial [Impatiens glandulifera]|uniref:pentatricopeptide repeat-containing protein At1g77360, mitochondrial n=1 Tax=Impatiens glandulifera TaxID=253017 RepID=UPI001FB075E6|nr:pentatricopeptide repeat-containing protein At1g77360, mitochondrial [Impatiens glandulifera]
MIRFRYERVKRDWLYAFLGRQYSSVDGGSNETFEPTKRICKILMQCPKVGLDTALDQSGIMISSNVVEEVLQRFQNAGLLTYRFFEWAGKQRHHQHSIKSYHIMIESLAKVRQYKIMWDLVNIMRSKKMLNIETFCIIMRKYARAKKVEEAVYTFNVMEKYDVKPNIAAFNGLLSALCKSKNVRRAQEIFDTMKEQFRPDWKTYCILLQGWGRAPNLPKAREIFSQMDCDPDIVTYGVMVDILSKAGRVDEAVEIVKDMDSRGCKPTSYIYSVLVHTYGLDNRIQDAVDIFIEMESNGIKPDVVVYNALISSFCKVNKFENISRVLNDMNLKDITPNSRTFNIILSNLIDNGKTDEALRVFRKMMKICDPDADTYTMMIRMFCGRNEVEMAENVWRYMKSKQFVPSMHTFSALINGMCEAGKVSGACILMEEMIERGISPSKVTFRRLRQLLLKEGREDVLEFINEKLNLMVKEPLCD